MEIYAAVSSSVSRFLSISCLVLLVATVVSSRKLFDVDANINPLRSMGVK